MAMVRILHQFRPKKEGSYHYCAVRNTKQITLEQCEVMSLVFVEKVVRQNLNVQEGRKEKDKNCNKKYPILHI